MGKRTSCRIMMWMLFIWIAFSGTVCAAGEEKNVDIKVVRVGIFSLGKFQGWDENGEAYGYNIDYLNEIAKRTHWRYEYVPCENWVEATALLESGAIDLLAPAQITEELSQKFSYTTLAMGTEAAAIYAKADRKDLLYEDFETMSSLRIGCDENSTFSKKFLSEYMPENNITPDIIYYANKTELREALDKGGVDAIVTNIMFAAEDLKILGWYSPLAVYYISQKENGGLLAQIDEAMLEITAEEPSFQPQLLSQYFPIYDSTHISYRETKYMESLPKLRVGYITNEKPLADTDSEGEFIGIAREIFDRILEVLGLEAEYFPLTKNQLENQEYLKSQDIHLIANYVSDANFHENVKTSKAYLELSQVIVIPKGVTVATDKAMWIATDAMTGTMSDFILKSYPNARIQVYEGMDKCFAALHSKEADIVLGKRYIVSPYLSKPVNREMRTIPAKGMDSSNCVGILSFDGDSEISRLLADDTMISIIDKAINQISNDDINMIVLKNTSANTYQYTLADFAYQYKYFLVTLFISILLIIGLLSVVSRNKQNAVRVIQSKNEQLAAAIEKANQANQAKSQFLAQMSHEIRTPMNAIIGLTTIARSDVKDPEKMKDFLAKIDSSSKLLLGIINDVLDMSAIESQKLRIAETEFDFKQMISSVTAVFYQQCKQKNITFAIRMHGVTEETMIGDSLRVNQILMNLLSNAVKFTPSGGEVSVLVMQGSMSMDTVHMRFIVSDTGCGMSEDLKNRLFHPFEQEDATTARKHGGSGLGLAITKSLVSLMGGSIQVESQKNVGSVFTVDIPFKRVKNQENPVEMKQFEQVRALIVDDEEESCQYVGILMERLGVTYSCATSGEAALEELGEAEDKGKPYNICMIDWKMPDMDGIAVTRKIREIFGSDTIVIIVSAYDLNEVEGEGRNAGADFFIPKPLFQSTIFDVLMRITKAKYEKIGYREIAGRKYDFTGHKVLIAEDVVLNMEVAVKLLNTVGIETVCAEDGVQAVELFERSEIGEYDAILLDINMPNKNGYEAAMDIRAGGRKDSRQVPIFAMTANAFTEDVTAALNAGMNGHIAKPIETDVLYRTLQKAFEESKGKQV